MEFTTRFELQSQATRLRYADYKWSFQETDGTVTLSDTLFQGTYPRNRTRLACHNTPQRVWQHGLFPLQSPLLRESLLVSFPPLNYMLKFSGSSCLIGDPKERLFYGQVLSPCFFLFEKRRTQVDAFFPRLVLFSPLAERASTLVIWFIAEPKLK